MLYAPLIFLVGLVVIVKNKNRNNEVLLASAYVVGAEILLRMTDAMYFNEFGKYAVLLFMVVGILFSSVSKYSIVYVFFILLLIPSLIVGILELSFDANIRKAIAFNLSGPVTLAVSAIYTFNRKVSFEQLKQLLFSFIYPLLAMLVYIILYTPTLKDAITGTESNFLTSGGFGPNQVSTVLGLGLFVAFALGLFAKNKLASLLFFMGAGLFAYRGLLTFSRGGLLAGIAISLALLYFVFINSKAFVKGKLIVFISVLVVISALLFTYTATQTGGMLTKRYEGKDSQGREKTSKFSGREKLAATELELFIENPLWGVGVGKVREEREERTGKQAATHNEITRMLAEHGAFGVFGLLILILTPLAFYATHRHHIFFVSFYLFWLLTINHAAMRIAAPAFVYALTLINIQFNAPKPPLHRQHP